MSNLEMSTDHDDWDIQEAYETDPKKALFALSSNLLQAEKLAKLIVKAIGTQSELQTALKDQSLKQIQKDHDIHLALFKVIADERKQFWHNLILNKKTVGVLVALLISVFVLKFTHQDWVTLALNTFVK